MFLGRELVRRGMLDEDSMERGAAKTLAGLRVTTVRSIRQPVGSLSGGQRQSVAVAKAVMWNSKLVILDEPTAALGVVQTRQVLDLVRRLRDNGLAVMLISHNLNDVFEVADRVAVLQLGRMVAQDPTSDFDRQSLVEYMTTGTSSRAGATARPAQREADLVARVEDDPVMTAPAPSGDDGGPVDDPTAATEAAELVVPPALVAQDLGGYLRGWASRVRNGDSGVLPVLVGMVLIAAVFEVISPNHVFLRRTTSSTSSSRALCSWSWPWPSASCFCSARSTCPSATPAAGRRHRRPAGGAEHRQLAVVVGDRRRAARRGSVGFVQGTLITRLRVPSFIVTLAGFLILNGIVLIVLGFGPFSGYPPLTGNSPTPSSSPTSCTGASIPPSAGWR